MRLVNAKYGIDLSLDESRPEILVFENRRIMREITEELWKQCSGLEGSFVLSDNKVLKIEKNVEIMINPFNLDFQSRKIMNALYTKMSAAANEQVEEKYRINADIIIKLILIEPNETKIIDSEHVTIIDRDLCLIERI